MKSKPINKNFLIREYVVNQKSCKQIGKEFNLSPYVLWKNLSRLKLIRTLSQSKTGNKNNMWKEKPQYGAMHDYIKWYKSKPKFCMHCHKNKRLDLANKDHKYSRDFKDYIFLCRSCHMIFDYKFNNRTRERRVKK